MIDKELNTGFDYSNPPTEESNINISTLKNARLIRCSKFVRDLYYPEKVKTDIEKLITYAKNHGWI